ncbi:hypothetical protein [Chryseobacterium luteum]|nr:hypothetical protein [Chryseobacterium luteum]
MENGEDVILAFMICNERKNKNDESLIGTAKKITIKYPNIKSITVGSGEQIVSYDDKSATYAFTDPFALADVDGRKGALLTVQNGAVTNIDYSFGEIHQELTAEERRNIYKNKTEADDPKDDYTNVNKTWKTKLKKTLG